MKKITTDTAVPVAWYARPSRTFEKTLNFQNSDGTDFDFTGVTLTFIAYLYGTEKMALTNGDGITITGGQVYFFKNHELYNLHREDYTYELIYETATIKKTWFIGPLVSSNEIRGAIQDSDTITISLEGESVTVTVSTGETAESIKSKYDTTEISTFTPANELTYDKDKIGEIQSGGTWEFTKAATGNRNGKTVSILLNTPVSVDFDSNDFLRLDGTTPDTTKLVHIHSYYNASLGKACYIIKNTTALDLTGPTISSATVEDVADTSLVVVFSEEVTITDTTGLSLNFTTGTAKTLTGTVTGSGTNTLTFTLSGSVEEGDVFTLEVGANNNIVDGAGNSLSATSQAVTNNVAVEFNPLAHPKLIAAYESDDVVLNGSTISQLNDKSGAGHHFVQATTANQPTLNVDVIDFDGVDDFLTHPTPANWGDFKTASGEVIAVMEIPASGFGVLVDFEDASDSLNRVLLGYSGGAANIWANNGSINQVNSGSVSAGYHIVSFRANGAAYTFNIDGVDVSTVVGQGSNIGKWFGGLTGSALLDRFRLSRFENTSHANKSKSIFFFNAELSPEDRASYVSHFNTKYP